MEEIHDAVTVPQADCMRLAYSSCVARWNTYTCLFLLRTSTVPDTVGTVGTVDTVDTVDTVGTVDTLDT